VVIEADPIPDDTTGVLQAFESMTVHTLVFERADDPLDHAILLWAVGRDELLLQPIVSTGLAKSPTLENQPVIAA
jgi:hypothetical protein